MAAIATIPALVDQNPELFFRKFCYYEFLQVYHFQVAMVNHHFPGDLILSLQANFNSDWHFGFTCALTLSLTSFQ